eukprot:SAG25_NODE_8783_length_404_cov_1.190164_2_plen_62_part_01
MCSAGSCCRCDDETVSKQRGGLLEVSWIGGVLPLRGKRPPVVPNVALLLLLLLLPLLLLLLP